MNDGYRSSVHSAIAFTIRSGAAVYIVILLLQCGVAFVMADEFPDISAMAFSTASKEHPSTAASLQHTIFSLGSVYVAFSVANHILFKPQYRLLDRGLRRVLARCVCVCVCVCVRVRACVRA